MPVRSGLQAMGSGSQSIFEPVRQKVDVHQTSEPDVRALYQYIQGLGSKGEEMPSHVPPEQEPETPYVSMVPQNMGVAGAGQDTTEERR